MPRSVRLHLASALLALHVAVTLGGAGLHALPGLGHDSGLRPLARNDHSHGPGKTAHEAADECPVCQFLAHGQFHHGHAVTVVARVTAEPSAPPPAPRRVSPPLSPSAPRAPPGFSRLSA